MPKFFVTVQILSRSELKRGGMLGTHVWSILPTSIFTPLTLYYISFILANLSILPISTFNERLSDSCKYCSPFLDIYRTCTFSVVTRLGCSSCPFLLIYPNHVSLAFCTFSTLWYKVLSLPVSTLQSLQVWEIKTLRNIFQSFLFHFSFIVLTTKQF